MPYLGALIVLYRYDPATPDRQLPPFIAIDRSSIEEGAFHPIYGFVLTGRVEDVPDWEERFYNQTCAAAALNGIDPLTLCAFGQAEIALVNYNSHPPYFIIDANRPFFDQPGMVAQIIETFELPKNPHLIDVVVGPVLYTTRFGDPPDPSPFVYDWDEDRVLDRPHTRIWLDPFEDTVPKTPDGTRGAACTSGNRSVSDR